ncbi:unnamed protein product [Amoebophrya sp. A120]|nr:unnamed protein product [Amoebophrya sp. A120]|eukprot:GSA120T00020143001.1
MQINDRNALPALVACSYVYYTDDKSNSETTKSFQHQDPETVLALGKDTATRRCPRPGKQVKREVVQRAFLSPAQDPPLLRLSRSKHVGFRFPQHGSQPRFCSIRSQLEAAKSTCKVARLAAAAGS